MPRHWCAVPGALRRYRVLEPQAGNQVVEKMRMSAWEGTRLEAMLKAAGRDLVIVTGAWTNMSIEHTARTGADKGFYMVVPEDSAAVNYAIQNVAMVTSADDLIAALS
jgi:gluconolactonase